MADTAAVADSPNRVAASGAAGDVADLIEYYFEQGWTDGLPVVPADAGVGGGDDRRARR